MAVGVRGRGRVDVHAQLVERLVELAPKPATDSPSWSRNDLCWPWSVRATRW